MNTDDKALHEETLKQFLNSQLSRAGLLKAAGAGLAIAAVPGVAGAAGTPVTGNPGSGRAPYEEFPFFPQIASGRYTTESPTTIGTVAVTAEALAVTLLTAAVGSGSQLNLTGLVLATVQAALVEEFAHLKVLQSFGLTPITTTFTVPDPAILLSQRSFFSTLEVAENLFIAAYMTATREFAELGQPTLAKLAYQIGGTEAEHRVLVRAALALAGDATRVPPNNKAFETDLLLYVSDAATILTQLGFIGGAGFKYPYPGDAAAIAAAGPMFNAVIQKIPNNATSTVTVTGPGDLTGERK